MLKQLARVEEEDHRKKNPSGCHHEVNDRELKLGNPDIVDERLSQVKALHLRSLN